MKMPCLEGSDCCMGLMTTPLTWPGLRSEPRKLLWPPMCRASLSLSEQGQLIHMNGATPEFLWNVEANLLSILPHTRPPVLMTWTVSGRSLYQASPLPM